jgi:hypothetical protein
VKLSLCQKLLLSRLVTLGEQALKRQLPVEVTEIFGFGSFFPGKQGPKDVDLFATGTSMGEPSASSGRFLSPSEQMCATSMILTGPWPPFWTNTIVAMAPMLPGLVSIDEERGQARGGAVVSVR